MNRNLPKIDDEIEIEIELICRRLKNSVNQIQVLNWLSNFKIDEIAMALKILNLVEYFDDTDIIEGYKICLENLFAKIGINNKLIIHPMGDYGKSGTAMIYFFKKAWSLLNQKTKIEYLPHYRNFKKLKFDENTLIILIDDILGSGSSASAYYGTFLRPQLVKNKYNEKVYFITIYSMKQASSLLQTKYKEIEVITYQSRNKVFSEPSPFGFRDKIIEFREMCYKYGKILFSTKDYNTEKEIPHPLGFKNSQALVSFSYGTPNNSLPVIWSDKSDWYPILPRLPEAKISSSKKFRKETAYVLSLMRSMMHNDHAVKFYSGEVTTSMGKRKFVTKKDFLLFSIMRLIKRKRSVPVICQMLGIREDEFNTILEEGKQKSIFDGQGQITAYGERIYLDVIKVINNSKNYQYSKKTGKEETVGIMYIPECFQGEK